MNERIKQLAEQATTTEYGADNGFDRVAFDKEKFTELIIKECSKVIEQWKKEPFPFDEDLAVELIHQNFGLELPPKNIKVIKI